MILRNVRVRSYGFTATIESHLLNDIQLKHLGLYHTVASESIELEVDGSFEIDEYDPNDNYLTLEIFDVNVYSPDNAKHLKVDAVVDLYDIEQKIIAQAAAGMYDDLASSLIDIAYGNYKNK